MPSSRYYAPVRSRVGSKEGCECMPCPVHDVDASQAIACGTRRDTARRAAAGGSFRDQTGTGRAAVTGALNEGGQDGKE